MQQQSRKTIQGKGLFMVQNDANLRRELCYTFIPINNIYFRKSSAAL